MPKNKDFKRLARTRMEKTGESYATARVRLLEKKSKAKANEKPDYAALAGMSNETVAAKTGCAWDKWVFVLDAVDAASMSHKEIAAHVYERYDVSAWWAQTVTVGYERIKGLREIGQRRGGGWEANKSKTFPVPLAKLYRACRHVKERAKWLPDAEIEVRKATPEKSMRITWGDGTPVEIYFWAKGDAKSQIQLQHSRLATKADADKIKAFWAERLTVLGVVLQG